MKVAYVAGPYRDPRGAHFVKQNIRRAEAAALELWEEGFFAFCPHLNTAFFEGAVPDEVILERDIEVIKRFPFDFLVALEGWGRSEGTCREIDAAFQKRTPVLFRGDPNYKHRLQEIKEYP
jgi:hypothetical protein